jgi:hypothetical protein
MTDLKDRDLVRADDGKQHTLQCVNEGWWRLDWESSCITDGVPPGGSIAARAERALFATGIAVLNVITLVGGVRRGR